MGLQPATFGSQLREKNNRPAGFDYLRIILSLGIIAWHTILVCYGEPTEARYWSGPFRPVFYFLVPSFFALSGFLVAGSLERNDIPSFLTLRAIRIYPALACEAILSAFILGPLVTSWSLGDYFSHQSFLNYLWNIIGYVHFTLPGVFDSNPGGPKVNQQLWTIPYELECYAAIAVLAIFKITKHPKAFFYALALACIAIVTYQYYGSTFRPIDRSPPGRMLVISFLFGAALFFIKDKVRFNGMLLALMLIGCWITMGSNKLIYLAPLPVTYVTIYLGLLDPPRGIITKAADYSYGLYLYGFPVQQTISYFFPTQRDWYFNFILSVVAASLLAIFSWHCVESPILNRKKSALKAVNRMMSRTSAKPQF